MYRKFDLKMNTMAVQHVKYVLIVVTLYYYNISDVDPDPEGKMKVEAEFNHKKKMQEKIFFELFFLDEGCSQKFRFRIKNLDPCEKNV